MLSSMASGSASVSPGVSVSGAGVSVLVPGAGVWLSAGLLLLPQAARPKTIARHRSSARSFLDFFIVIYLPFRKIAQFGPDDFVLPSLSVCPYYTLSLRKGQPPFYMIQKIFYRIVTDVTDLNPPL